jgi:hypothetical protein
MIRHSDAHSVLRSGGKDGEPPWAVEGRADDPSRGNGGALMLPQLECGLELFVLEEDGFSFDHPLQHCLPLALELGILARGVPVVAGARKDAFCRGCDLMERSGDGAGHVERRSANGVERLRGNQREGEEDDADDNAGDHRKKAEEEPVLGPPRPAGTRGRHRSGPF